MEPIIRGVFEEFGEGKPVTPVFPRIPYEEAIRKYGTDKPDLRNPIEMQDVTEHFRGSGFKVFAGMIEKDPKVRVWAIPAPGGGSRAFCDRMNSWAQGEGQPGLGYIFWREGEEGEAPAPSPRTSGRNGRAIRDQIGLEVGDACFFVAGDPAKFYKFAGLARDRIGRELNLIDENRYEFAWIVDFPFSSGTRKRSASIRAQSVLDAPRRQRGSRCGDHRRRAAQDQGIPVRPCL